MFIILCCLLDMVHCCAYGCHNQRRNNKSVSYHRLPSSKRDDIRKAWIHAIGRTDLPKDSQVFVCSDHFDESCFEVSSSLKVDLCPELYTSSNTKKNLRFDAVPTIFSHKSRPTERTFSSKRAHQRLVAEVISS